MRGLVFKNRLSTRLGSAVSEAEEKDGWLCINVYSVGGVLGASLCVGWHLSLLLRPDLLYASGGFMEPLYGIMGFIIATFLVYFVMSMGASLVQSHRSVGGIVALVSALVAFFPLGGGGTPHCDQDPLRRRQLCGGDVSLGRFSLFSTAFAYAAHLLGRHGAGGVLVFRAHAGHGSFLHLRHLGLRGDITLLLSHLRSSVREDPRIL